MTIAKTPDVAFEATTLTLQKAVDAAYAVEEKAGKRMRANRTNDTETIYLAAKAAVEQAEHELAKHLRSKDIPGLSAYDQRRVQTMRERDLKGVAS